MVPFPNFPAGDGAVLYFGKKLNTESVKMQNYKRKSNRKMLWENPLDISELSNGNLFVIFFKLLCFLLDSTKSKQLEQNIYISRSFLHFSTP